jgi:hypothetical protein
MSGTVKQVTQINPEVSTMTKQWFSTGVLWDKSMLQDLDKCATRLWIEEWLCEIIHAN